MWTTTTKQTKSIAWEEAARVGGKSQLEPTEKLLQVSDLHGKLHNDLGKARESNVRGSWCNHMRKLGTHNAKDDRRVILTDFSAALDLRTRTTDNCSVDDHSALGARFLLETREVALTNGSIAKTHTTGAWCFFGSSTSAGKKNDRVLHSKCVGHMAKKAMKKEKL